LNLESYKHPQVPYSEKDFGIVDYMRELQLVYTNVIMPSFAMKQFDFRKWATDPKFDTSEWQSDSETKYRNRNTVGTVFLDVMKAPEGLINDNPNNVAMLYVVGPYGAQYPKSGLSPEDFLVHLAVTGRNMMQCVYRYNES